MEINRGVFVLLLFVLSFSGVYAMAGVSPPRYDVDFKPGLKQDFDFNFIFNKDSNAEVYVSGEFAEYVKLDKKKIVGSEIVRASLELPENIDIPGRHSIIVGARQVPSEGGGMMLAADIRAMIRVMVPYPGKYADLSFSATNANVGEDIEFLVTVYSRGDLDIYATPLIEISNSDEKFETLNLGTKLVKSTKNEEFSKSLNTINYLAGDYNATVIVDYGGEKPATASKVFRLGELFIGILNTSNYFERDKINKFKINVESFWNDPIKDVFAKVKIENYDIEFLTPSIDIAPWQKTDLIGYFDTSNIKEDNFKANVTLFYEEKITSKIVDLEFESEVDYTLYVVVGGLVLIMVILAFVLIWLLRRRKNEKKK